MPGEGSSPSIPRGIVMDLLYSNSDKIMETLHDELSFFLQSESNRIMYSGTPNEKLDKEIIKVCESRGFKWWAQGYNFETDMRDICFDPPS